MIAENTEVLRELISSYFDKFVQPKIEKLDKMIDQGFTEEALILALCYIDAMANFYSYNDDILCFSKEIILSTLKNVHKNLKAECIYEAKWPFELV